MKPLLLILFILLTGCLSNNQEMEKNLEQKIAEIVDQKIKKKPSIRYSTSQAKLTGSYSRETESIVYARKSNEVEIDGRKHQKIYLASSGVEIIAPISKKYKSGKRVVAIILTVDEKTIKSDFELKVGQSASDFLLGQNFIIDNFFKD